ncbi:VOC family protein [Gammaproteobacteria bacterium]|nr:VOC family protein [Gammaproteobacteria bacterium]
MIDHISTYCLDFDASLAFYSAVFDRLGYPKTIEMAAEWDSDFPTRRLCAFGENGKSTFWLIESRVASTPRHLAFVAPDRAAVDAFHRAALDSGGQDNGAPGLRPIYHQHYYGAFAFDPDGNNIEAVCHRAIGA